jgi:hypothetical protein
MDMANGHGHDSSGRFDKRPFTREEIMAEITTFTRHSTAIFAVFAGLVIVAVPTEPALGDKPASPVTVVNPDTSPVPTSVVNPATMPALTSSIDVPGRIPYQSVQIGRCDGLTICTVQFPTVPSNHRLVVRHVSGNYTFHSTPSVVQASLVPIINLTPVPFSGFFAPFNTDISTFDVPVLHYFEAGDIPGFALVVGGTTVNAAVVTLFGYLLNCSASLCAPIAP